ncbi:hypothetical protein [Flavobacterium sp.]|uniref:hypothetical protein n=1 Tax=Flavobacterium sp. TaxID=239 RepID=UPI0037526FC5
MMRIIVKKVKRENLEIIQSELFNFLGYKIDNLPSSIDYQSYCNDVLVIDLLQGLFHLLRRKIESQRTYSNLILSPSQGVILLYCHQWQTNSRSEQNAFVMQRVSDAIHQNLINLI